MRCIRHRAPRLLGALGTVAIIGFAAPASAQIVFDGNVLFGNNASGTLAGQFTGVTSTGPTCALGLTPAGLVSGVSPTYTHNVYADPLLTGAIFGALPIPNFQPPVGSPAWSNRAVVLPNDGFFEPTCWAGAIGPGPGQDWTGLCNGKGPRWTYWDSTGATRQDLHLPGMPDPRPLATYTSISLYSSQTWSADSNYLVNGQLRVKEQASLTIPAGVVVFQSRATVGTIIIERGARIFAIGTCKEPIVITGDDPPGLQATGCGGGLIIHGRARVNVVNSCAGDSAASEGGLVGYYGGNDDDDDSGELRYVRVEYAGREITPNNELNSFTFNGVGRRTRVEYVQAFMGADDGLETFGGTVDLKHALAIDGTDDGLDWQLGWRGRAQFVIVRVSPKQAPSGTQFGEKGIEADNNEFGHLTTLCSGRSNPTVANLTIVGDRRAGPPYPGSTSAVNLRRGTGGQVLNSIVYNFKQAGLRIDDNGTWENHCTVTGAGVAPNPNPIAGAPVACGFVDVPLHEGQMFVSAGAPNPFRSQVAVNFMLPRAGEVTVRVYSSAGHQVATLYEGAMAAGPQRVTWNVGRDVKPGVYFYRVEGVGQRSTGKIVRVD